MRPVAEAATDGTPPAEWSHRNLLLKMLVNALGPRTLAIWMVGPTRREPYDRVLELVFRDGSTCLDLHLHIHDMMSSCCLIDRHVSTYTFALHALSHTA